MIKMDNKKALKPGGHYEYSTKIYFFAPIGAYHVDLSPEARARLKEASVNVEIGERPQIRPTKAKAAEKTKSWIEQHVFDGLQRLAADPAALNGPLTTWIPRILFLLMPLYALLLALFYIRQRKTFLLRRSPDLFADHPHLRVRRCCSRRRARRSSCRRDGGLGHAGDRGRLQADRDAELLSAELVLDDGEVRERIVLLCLLLPAAGVRRGDGAQFPECLRSSEWNPSTSS